MRTKEECFALNHITDITWKGLCNHCLTIGLCTADRYKVKPVNSYKIHLFDPLKLALYYL